ncbi:hypothetical protein NC652_041742 [Populus alba x Populus x berolinensis]|nr:hypothetical protein NC652_041742 [Populus alba x Populus x berolinensis]
MTLLSDPSGKREFRFSIKSSILAQGFSVSVHLVAAHCDLKNPVKSVHFQTLAMGPESGHVEEKVKPESLVVN